MKKASELLRELINWIIDQNIESSDVSDILDEMLDRYALTLKTEALEEKKGE